MKCPKCNVETINKICVRCGYMENGSVASKPTDEVKVSNLETYIGDEYQSIVYNKHYLLTFAFGPLYFCYRNLFFLGFFLGMFDIFAIINLNSFFMLVFSFLDSLPVLGTIFKYIFAAMFSFGLSRLFYMSFANEIYLAIMRHKIKRIDISKPHTNSNSFLPFLVIIIYIMLIIVLVYVFRTL